MSRVACIPGLVVCLLADVRQGVVSYVQNPWFVRAAVRRWNRGLLGNMHVAGAARSEGCAVIYLIFIICMKFLF